MALSRGCPVAASPGVGLVLRALRLGALLRAERALPHLLCAGRLPLRHVQSGRRLPHCYVSSCYCCCCCYFVMYSLAVAFLTLKLVLDVDFLVAVVVVVSSCTV